MKNYKMMKVFDCQDMPEDIQDAFFKLKHNFASPGNDTYLMMQIDHCIPEAVIPEDKIVQEWLVANGALPGKDSDSEGEEVLVKHWW